MSITCKQPNAEPTEKQLAFFNTLMAERGYPTIEAFADDCTRQGASDAIEAAKTLPKQGKGQPKPTMDALVATLGVEATDYQLVGDAKPSLMDLAAQITGQAPAAPDPATEGVQIVRVKHVAKPEFTDSELGVLRAALTIVISETDGQPVEFDLHDRIDAYLTAKGA